MDEMKFTILGGSGFIGGNLARHLQAQGHDVCMPARDARLERHTPAGHVIYAIGLTGDFRQRLHETIEANVSFLSYVLQTLSFDSFLYLSSTRVYGGLPAEAVAGEASPLSLIPNSDTVYDLSKLLGEALCLSQPQATVRVARLSNIVGSGQSEHTFLGALLSEGRRDGRVAVREAPLSSKDYIALDDVIPLLVQIALTGRERLYNVASGTPLNHAAIAEAIRKAIGIKVEFMANAPNRSFPRINIDRIQSEFAFEPRPILGYIATLLQQRNNDVRRPS
jgi:nucleoside-diphosphate-sugar epimerase